MDSRVSGVRIMDANTNQGVRAVYMNRRGQTVEPKSGRTVSNETIDGLNAPESYMSIAQSVVFSPLLTVIEFKIIHFQSLIVSWFSEIRIAG